MPYNAASSFLSSSQILQTVWIDQLAAHGADRPGEIVSAYFGAAPLAGLNPDLALAQAVEETGWFTSELWRTRRNPAGIGITGPGVLGLDYRTIIEGVKAHLAHLLCYAYTSGSCPLQRLGWSDARHFFHDGNPTLRHLQDGSRQWATGANYVEHILAVLAVVGGASITPKVDVVYTKRVLLVPPGMDNRPGNSLNGTGVATSYTVHNTDNPKPGANAAMHAKFVQGGGGPDTASFHDVADDHEVIQLIPYNEAAFHIGDWSTGPGWISSYGIEICENIDGDFRAACWNGAQAIADRMIVNGHAGQYERIRTHGSWWTPQHPQVHQNCPARLLTKTMPDGSPGPSWDDFVNLVKKATLERSNGGTTVDDSSKRLLDAYHALPAYMQGVTANDVLYECGLDFSTLEGAPVKQGHGLHSEYVTLWTAPGQPVKALQPETFLDLKNAGKVQKF